ncbi:50S ribosomal protein L13 [Bacteroidota bacterium]
MKTYSAKPADIKRKWHEIDATDKILGRLATQVAKLLIGKHKAIFTRNQDTGDYVVVINADKVRVSGDKMKQKMYYRHSGYPGGLKTTSLEDMMKAHPTRVIEHAVKGMLPHNRLGAQMYRKLRVYVGSTHPHPVQKEDASKTVKN